MPYKPSSDLNAMQQYLFHSSLTTCFSVLTQSLSLRLFFYFFVTNCFRIKLVVLQGFLLHNLITYYIYIKS